MNTLHTVRYVLQLLNVLLLSVGLWKLFPKFGICRKWALVPYARIYKLSVCADREESGLSYMLCSVIASLLTALVEFLERHKEELEKEIDILTVVLMAVTIIGLIYQCRLYAGICEAFGKSKGWVIVWVFAESIPAMLWGWSQKDMPVANERQKTAALSGISEEDSGEGLVVDLKSRDVGWLFNKKTLLRDIHFTVKPGTMLLLLGGSGSGKTTLVNAITGYEKADAHVMLNGEDVYSSFDSMKYKIGYVPQQETLRLNDSVYRTVEDNARLRLPDTFSSEQIDERVSRVLDSFGLTPAGKSFVSKQSGGMKKRVSISMEYVSDPEFFVLDEPDSGLDGIMAKDLMRRLKDISREGKIVIVITHTPDRVIDLFDQVLVLARDSAKTGRLAFLGTPREAREFFARQTMEEIICVINRKDEGGEGRGDEMIERFEALRNPAGQTANTEKTENSGSGNHQETLDPAWNPENTDHPADPEERVSQPNQKNQKNKKNKKSENGRHTRRDRGQKV